MFGDLTKKNVFEGVKSILLLFKNDDISASRLDCLQQGQLVVLVNIEFMIGFQTVPQELCITTTLPLVLT